MFLKLLLAHVIADFVFQTSSMDANKKDLKVNLKHCLIVLIISLLLFVNNLSSEILIAIFVITLFHGVIDYLKALAEEWINNPKYNWLIFIVDQVLHVALIILILLIIDNSFDDAFLSRIDQIFASRNWIKMLLFFVIITFGGSHFIAVICKKFEPDKNNMDSLESAGEYIGILERIIVSAAILLGRYEIIGFLIAAKIIRFPDKDAGNQFSEYVLIGTLTSFIWASLFTFLYMKI